MRMYMKVDDKDLGVMVDKKHNEIHVRVGKEFAERLAHGMEVDFILPIKMR